MSRIKETTRFYIKQIALYENPHAHSLSSLPASLWRTNTLIQSHKKLKPETRNNAFFPDQRRVRKATFTRTKKILSQSPSVQAHFFPLASQKHTPSWF